MTDAFRSIPERTQVRVYTGYDVLRGLAPTPSESIAYNLTASAVSLQEGGSLFKLQAYGSGTKLEAQRVPFVMVDPVTGAASVRGVDYQIVDAEVDGELIPGDYVQIPAGAIRGDLWLEPLTNGASSDDSAVLLQLVQSNAFAVMGADASVGQNNECLIEIQDTSAPSTARVSFAQNQSTATEPDGTATINHQINVTLDRVALGTVTATITVLEGTAENPRDYTLPAGTVQFLLGEQTKPFTVTVNGNDDYQGQRNVRLQISAVTGGEILAGSAEHTLTIEDNELDVDWTVNWDPLHEGALQLLEGGTAGAKLVFSEGVANTAPVQVAWEFVDTGGAGLALGSQITTSATNPVTIPAGLTSVTIPLDGATDDVVSEAREFELRLGVVTGGGATAGTDNTLVGTLLDTTIVPPSVSWSDSTDTVVEGSSIQSNLVLSEAAANPITVLVRRAGTASASDLTWDGESVALTFPIGSITLPVNFTALQDQTSDPSETATFTILDGVGYTAGGNNVFTVTITEPVAGSSTVEFKPTPGMNTLVSVCTGMDPTPITSPPQMIIGGVKCDAFPIDVGRRTSDPVAWEFVAYGDFPNGTATLEADDGSAQYGAGYSTEDLSGLQFQLQTHLEGAGSQWSPHTVTLGDGMLVEVTKEGHYVKDELWLIRPRLESEAGTKHEYCAQILVWLTRRPDCVKVRAQLMNEGYDPTRAEGHYGSEDIRHELDGPIQFHTLTVGTQAVNPRVQMCPDSIATTAGAYAIRQSLSHTVDDGFGGFTSKAPPHLLPPQRVFCWDFGVFDSATTENYQRDYILRGTGEGWAIDGDYAFYKRPWFSPNAAHLPEPDSGYSHKGGFTGLEACRQYGGDYLTGVLRVIRGTADMNPQGGSGRSGMWYRVGEFGGDQYGWFCPSTWRWNYQHGGEGINLQAGFDMDPNTQRAMWLDSRHKIQADTSGILDITTGLPLTATVAAQYNVGAPGQQGFSPLFGSPNNVKHGHEWHWFLPVTAGGSEVEDQKRPTNRKWSELPTLSGTTDPLFVYAEPLEVQSSCGPIMDPSDASNGQSLDNYNFGTPDLDHLVRVSAVYKALAWSRNSSWAKYQLRRIASRVEYLFSYVPIRGQASTDAAAQANQDMTQTAQRLLNTVDGGHVHSTNSINYGGFGVRSQWWTLVRGRGAAHATDAQAAAGAVTPELDAIGADVQDYADRKNWWDRYLSTSKDGASLFGSFERESGKDRHGRDVGDPQTDNHPWSSNYWETGSHIPKDYGCTQWWKTAWYACRHFSGNKVYGDAATYAANIRQFCDTQALAMFRVPPLGSRVSGRSRPMHHIISSDGAWGQENPPGALPVSWDVKYGPDSYHPVGSPALADTRICQLMVESLRGLDEMGKTTLYNELLGYIKVFFGLTEAYSLSSLIAKLQAEMSRDMKPNQRWAAGYVSDLLGFLQHKNRA